MTQKTIDTQKLDELIKKGDFVAAKKAIDDFVTGELTEEQRAEAFVHLTSTYLDISNKHTTEYIAKLDEAMQMLKDLKISQRKSDDEFRKEEITLELQDTK